MRTWFSWRRGWMLAGFCSAWFVGDFFLAVRAAPRDSTEFLIGVANTEVPVGTAVGSVSVVYEDGPAKTIAFLLQLPFPEQR